MNRTDFLNGQGGNARQSMVHFRDSIQDAFAMVLSDYTLTSTAMKVTGCDVSTNTVGSTTTVTITAGVAALNGELFRVAAHNIARDVAEVAWLAPFEEFVDVNPAINFDGVATGNQVKRTLVLTKGDNYPASGTYVPLDASTQLALLQGKLASRLMPIGAMFPVDTDDIALSGDNWSSTGLGLSSTPAQGLALCNGLNGTIDMRGLTPIGSKMAGYSTGAPSLAAGVDPSTAYAPEDVVGSFEHTLTEAEMPAHTHTEEKRSGVVAGSSVDSGSFDLGTTEQDTGSTGDGGAHNNMQPSKALVWVKVVA